MRLRKCDFSTTEEANCGYEMAIFISDQHVE